MTREIKYKQAILEATDQCMAKDPLVYLMGLGVPDPKGIFGTTLGLHEKYGDKRVMDMPTSENAMTGIAIGSAILGHRPIMTHQRVDFILLALDQIINNAAKWHYMFDGQMNVPLVIRIIIGRGWGQGPQHSQSLQSLFAHIPGLKVIMPTTPMDAKGLLISAIEDNNPVICLEHRWLYETFGPVSEDVFRIPLGKAHTIKEGTDVTLVSSSYMTLEAIRAAELLSKEGISAEVIDLRTVKPLDGDHILNSVKKTGRLIVADGDWKTLGLGAEIVALVAEEMFGSLKANPQRIAFPDHLVPTSWAISPDFYPGTIDIVNSALRMMGKKEKTEKELGLDTAEYRDVPNKNYTGPF